MRKFLKTEKFFQKIFKKFPAATAENKKFPAAAAEKDVGLQL
jgi:hypothetical protein